MKRELGGIYKKGCRCGEEIRAKKLEVALFSLFLKSNLLFCLSLALETGVKELKGHSYSRVGWFVL